MVVSNHPDLGHFVDNYGIPFRHVPVDPESKQGAEAESSLRLVSETEAELSFSPATCRSCPMICVPH